MNNKALLWIILALLSLFTLSSFTIIDIHKKDLPTEAHTFRFTLPIPPDVCRSFKVSATPPVREVYVAGLFSEWSSNDPHYRMETRSNAQGAVSWALSLDPAPGRTQYKYVVYIEGRPDPVWVYDTSNPRKVPDGFEGFNSLLVRTDTLPLWQLLQQISLVLAIALLLYLIIPLAWPLFTKSALSRPGINDLGLGLLLILMPTLLLLLQGTYLRRYIREAYLHTAGLMHRSLDPILSQSSEPFSLSSRLDMIQALEPYTLPAPEGTHPGFPISHYFILDTSLNLQLNSGPEHPGFESGIEQKDMLTWIPANIFPEFYRAGNSNSLHLGGPRWSFPSPSYYQALTDDSSKSELKDARRLGFQVLLMPLRQNSRTRAYLGLLIDPGPTASFLARSRRISLALSGIFLALIFILYRRRIPSSPASQDQFFQTYNITDREKDIISLIIRGSNNQEIGRRLFISEKTVKSHIYNIYQKVGIQNRIELLNKMREQHPEE